MLAALLVVAALVAAIFGVARPDSWRATPSSGSTLATSSSGDWTWYRYDLAGTGNNPTSAITTANVAQLTTRWTFGPQKVFASTPAIVGDTVHASNNASLYAFDRTTGLPLWHVDAPPTRMAPCSAPRWP